MCRVKSFNLSYESLTSYAVRDQLCNLKKTDPEFWKELTTASTPVANNPEQKFDEDDTDEPDTLCFDDDSDVVCNVVIAHVGKSNVPNGIVTTSNGNLARAAEAESMEANSLIANSLEAIEGDEQNTEAPLETEELGPGKRKCRANTLYKANVFWRHHDEDDPDLDM